MPARGVLRDVVAGLLVAAAGVVWTLSTLTPSLAPVTGVRPTAVVVTALGLVACLVGGRWLHPPDPVVMRPLAGLGLLAAIAAVVTLVTADPAALFGLVLLMPFLWLLATIHHGARRRGGGPRTTGPLRRPGAA